VGGGPRCGAGRVASAPVRSPPSNSPRGRYARPRVGEGRHRAARARRLRRVPPRRGGLEHPGREPVAAVMRRAVLVEHWWNGVWGRMARRDVWLRSDVNGWTVEICMGGLDSGKRHEWATPIRTRPGSSSADALTPAARDGAHCPWSGERLAVNWRSAWSALDRWPGLVGSSRGRRRPARCHPCLGRPGCSGFHRCRR
jgi:hypothetical protein